MRFAFGLGFNPNGGLDEFQALVRTAEEAGFGMVMTGDTPAIMGDTYVGLTTIATTTSRCRVGTYISNPLTRHPTVAASAIASVNAIAKGRAFFGISTGDSGVYNLGLKPAKLAQLEEYIVAVRALLEQGEAIYGGRPLKLDWYRGKVPIYMAPGGPKGLRLAGRVADGVFLETGFMPEVIADTLRQLEEAAVEAGRSLADIDIWWHARTCMGATRDDAIEKIRSGLLGIGNRLARFQQEGKFIPDEIWPRLQELKRRYDFMGHHESSHRGGRQRNADMLDELDLRDYLADRFGLLGNPDDILARIGQLKRMGVRNIAITALMPDKLDFLKSMQCDVMPRLTLD